MRKRIALMAGLAGLITALVSGPSTTAAPGLQFVPWYRLRRMSGRTMARP